MKLLTVKLKKGFTLSELLISLAILGLIAGFAIPKVLHSVEEQHKRAVFKETIATLQSLLVNGLREGTYATDGSNTFAYYRDRLQATRVCPTHSINEGCWPAVGQGEGNEPGFILPNGVMLTGFNNPATIPGNGFNIDYNGLAGPNQIGQDEVYLILCHGTTVACQAQSGWFYTNTPIRSGAMGPFLAGGGATNKTLYDWIFSK